MEHASFAELFHFLWARYPLQRVGEMLGQHRAALVRLPQVLGSGPFAEHWLPTQDGLNPALKCWYEKFCLARKI